MAGNYPTKCPRCGEKTEWESCDGGEFYSSCYGMCPNCGAKGEIVSCPKSGWCWDGKPLEEEQPEIKAEEFFVIKFAPCSRCEGTGWLPPKREHCSQNQVNCPSCQVYRGKVIEYVPLQAALQGRKIK